jgi:hypothetical protein
VSGAARDASGRSSLMSAAGGNLEEALRHHGAATVCDAHEENVAHARRN